MGRWGRYRVGMADRRSLQYRRLRARGVSARLARLWGNRVFAPSGANSVPGNRASLITGTGNGRILWVARTPGTTGNGYTVRFVVAGNNTALSVTNTAGAITVNLATNGSGVATSTAADVVRAIKLSYAQQQPGAALSYVWPEQVRPGSDGTGVQVALAATNLTGAV